MKFLYEQLRLLKLIAGLLFKHRGQPPVKKRYFSGSKKSFIFTLIELLVWLFRERDLCKMYYAFGLNLRGSSIEEYIGPLEIDNVRQAIEADLRLCYQLEGLNYRVVCKDKNIAAAYLSSYGVNTLETIALIVDGVFISTNHRDLNVQKLLSMQKFVLKRPSLEASGGFNFCKVISGEREPLIVVNEVEYELHDFEKLIENGLWILQKALVAHSDLVSMAGVALHTTRIVTVRTPKGVRVVSGFQAFTTGGAKSDSWANGSIYVGIDTTTRCLQRDGFYSPWHKNGAIVTTHPDTNIEFEGFRIPFYDEAERICIDAHKLLYATFIVGWDVAITDDGPVIVECNETPGMNAIQCVDRGLRKDFLAMLKDTKAWKQ